MTKEPQRRVGRGHTYRGHLLIPTARGRVELELVAHEGGETGERERAVTAERFSGERPGGWSRDPYGYVYAELPPESSELDPLPVDLTLRSLADEESYDLLFPDHPLSQVREVLARLSVLLDEPSALRVPRGRSQAGGVSFFLPLGFLTGLLGINVGGMPGVNDGHAFWWVTGICLAIIAVLMAIFKRLKWL